MGLHRPHRPCFFEGTATWNPDAFSDTPVTADCCCTYADGVKIVLRSSGAFQDRYIRFVGSEGWVQVDDETNAVTAEPKSILQARERLTADGIKPVITCELARLHQVACSYGLSPESAHRATTICHAVNIGLRLGRSLKWDPQSEQFLDDAQANSMLVRAMRERWSVM